MTKDEIVDLLLFCAGYDHRHVTDEETDRWQRSLWRLDLNEAMAAVVEYYETERERIMPADVSQRARPPAARHPSSVPVPPKATVAESVTMLGAERVRRVMREAHEANQARRDRVLRYPDLAGKLRLPPLEFTWPEQWDGFVPPAECQDVAPGAVHSPSGVPNEHHKRTGATEKNDSPRRAALVEICAEAMRRERAATAEAGGVA